MAVRELGRVVQQRWSDGAERSGLGLGLGAIVDVYPIRHGLDGQGILIDD